MSTTHPHLVAVYGTLRRGFGNNHVLARGGSKFVGTGKTRERFILSSYGIPFVWDPGRAARNTEVRAHMGHIAVEVWACDDRGLEACDRLEGHPDYYCRDPIVVAMDAPCSKMFETCGLYFMPRKPDAKSWQKPDKNGLLTWDGGRTVRAGRLPESEDAA